MKLEKAIALGRKFTLSRVGNKYGFYLDDIHDAVRLLVPDGARISVKYPENIVVLDYDGGMLPIKFTFDLNDGMIGPYYVFVRTDNNDDVFGDRSPVIGIFPNLYSAIVCSHIICTMVMHE